MRATEYFDSIESVYILFGDLQTKEYVASKMKSPYHFLDVKATRIGSLVRLFDHCSKRMSENPEIVVSDADSLHGNNLNDEGKKFGAIFVADEADGVAGTGFFAEEFHDKRDQRLVLSQVEYQPCNINWTVYYGNVSLVMRWVISLMAVAFTVLIVGLSLASF